MIFAITANGPGEFAGWVRPLVAALYARLPALDVRVFCVPDDYATGYEPEYVRRLFPQAVVYPTADYVRFALGRPIAGLPPKVDHVQYLGGDLMHAGRVHDRLGGIATSYKFARKRDAARFARVFALDDANRDKLRASGVPSERITVVGNLAIDGALGEADGQFGAVETDVVRDGVLIFAGSRKLEIATATPMFVRFAVQLRRRLPGVPIAFARSPFTSDDDLAAALASGGVRTSYAHAATVERTGGIASAIIAGDERFPLVTDAMRAAQTARLAVSIPGTKLIELAALGVPAVTITPYNAPEMAVINGPLQYMDRLPFVGIALKRTAVVAVANRFRWFAQPNMDAGRELDPEMRGTILPSRAASVVAKHFLDRPWRAETSAALRALYAAHAGAAGRMADALLEGAV